MTTTNAVVTLSDRIQNAMKSQDPVGVITKMINDAFEDGAKKGQISMRARVFQGEILVKIAENNFPIIEILNG